MGSITVTKKKEYGYGRSSINSVNDAMGILTGYLPTRPSVGADRRLLAEHPQEGERVGSCVGRQTEAWGELQNGPFPLQLCTNHKAEPGIVYENAQKIRNGK